MDLMHWSDDLADPLQEFESLQEEINRLFEGFRAPEPRGLFERTFSPAVDVIEEDDRYEVLCDLPGVEPGGIETSISGSVLTIKGERHEPSRAIEDKTYRTDRRAGGG